MHGWLIEADGTFWNGRSLDRSSFQKDTNDAIRFSRFEDAERIKHWLLRDYAFALKTTEHVWLEQQPETSTQQSKDTKTGGIMELGVPIKLRGTSGKFVAFISYRDVPEFHAVKAESEMGKMILDCVAKGERIPDEHKARIWNESRRCAINEVID